MVGSKVPKSILDLASQVLVEKSFHISILVLEFDHEIIELQFVERNFFVSIGLKIHSKLSCDGPCCTRNVFVFLVRCKFESSLPLQYDEQLHIDCRSSILLVHHTFK